MHDTVEPEKPGVSVILPVFEEAENLPLLFAEILPALASTGLSWEIIAVDDGSRDGSDGVLARLAAAIPELRVATHARRRGAASAMLTGVALASGGIVVTMDADGQHDPAEIPALLAPVLAGRADAVCPVRPRRVHPPLKRLASAAANAVRATVLRDGVRDSGFTFRAARREAIAGLPRFRGLHRFMPGLLKLHGWRVEQPVVAQRSRSGGRSKYGLFNRLAPGIVDLAAMAWYRLRYAGPPPPTDSKLAP